MTHIRAVVLVSLFVLCFSADAISMDETEMHKCIKDPIISQDCPKEFTGVCAHFLEVASLKLKQMYTANSCLACKHDSVQFYNEGKCNANKVYCDANCRPDSCTEEKIPVCAYSFSKDKEAVRKTVSNECVACSTQGVDFLYT